jgi:2-C-methyl-D-erythritol 2,4-cyclodiphosphate synthase
MFDLVRADGYTVVNVDIVVIAQQAKVAPHADAMQRNLASALWCDASRVSVKGKTNEGVDSMGAGESIAVHAVVLLERGAV